MYCTVMAMRVRQWPSFWLLVNMHGNAFDHDLDKMTYDKMVLNKLSITHEVESLRNKLSISVALVLVILVGRVTQSKFISKNSTVSL